ncbi:hypothetical protein DSO57_1025882 [Entomophthora muscae]|uniref:Uncharacterized protein n=1 Tax=Entomophthora muscae TaxID=34485 RepID=A0ACC2SRG2_9FUNG|nr:hypothetical protein DSO57_1025882 [Entomophthora muscae]
MGPGANPEPNSPQPVSSEDQGLSWLQPINIKSMSTRQDMNPCQHHRSFQANHKCLIIEVSLKWQLEILAVWVVKSATHQREIPKPASGLRPDTCSVNPPNTMTSNDHPPEPDARSFSEIPTCDTGRLVAKLASLQFNCPKFAQSLANDAGPENWPNINNQVVEQKDLKAYSAEIANDDLPVPDSTLPSLESQYQPT